MKLIDLYCAVAGALDTVTGLLLVATPTVTLGWMGIANLPVEPVYMSWIGVFVGSIGLFYLLPFVLPALLGGAKVTRQIVVLEVTALARCLVAAFVAVSVLRGALEPAWMSVAATDLGLAVAQGFLLRRVPNLPEAPRSTPR